MGFANEVEHGKRPLSSMVPTIVVDSSSAHPVLVLGGAGHTRITTGVAQVSCLVDTSIFRNVFQLILSARA